MFAEERESVEGENQFTSYQDLVRSWRRREEVGELNLIGQIRPHDLGMTGG